MTALKLSVDDPEFVDKIIFEVKSQGHFDLFRKECLADVGKFDSNAIAMIFLLVGIQKVEHRPLNLP